MKQEPKTMLTFEQEGKGGQVRQEMKNECCWGLNKQLNTDTDRQVEWSRELCMRQKLIVFNALIYFVTARRVFTGGAYKLCCLVVSVTRVYTVQKQQISSSNNQHWIVA